MKRILLLFLLFLQAITYSQTATENYVKTITYQVATTDGNVTHDEKQETITYYDGLNRPKQTISIQAGGNRQDIITPILYDQFGRTVKNYMPLAVSGNGDNFYTGDIETELKGFYRNKFPQDFNATNSSWDNPYSEKLFEDSPLNQVKEVAAPGYDWRLGNGGVHTKKYDFETNASFEVKKYLVSYNQNNEPLVINDGFYLQNSLFKTVHKNENWTVGLINTSETFTDKNGKTLLTNSY